MAINGRYKLTIKFKIMANVTESENYDAGVYRYETGDSALGGETGIMAKPIKNLANRTKWLKTAVDAINIAIAGLVTPPSIDNHQEVIGVSTITAPGTEADMASTGVSFTPKGKKILIIFSAKFDSAAGGSVICFICYNGSDISNQVQAVPVGGYIVMSMQKLQTVTPGISINVKMRWTGSSDVMQHGGLANRVLTIIDLP